MLSTAMMINFMLQFDMDIFRKTGMKQVDIDVCYVVKARK